MNTVLKFPDRMSEVQEERRARRAVRPFRTMAANAASLSRSGLSLFLMPSLLWLSMLDRMEREARPDDADDE